MKLHVSLQKEPDGGYVARCLELPGALTQGETEEEAIASIREAILTILDMMKEQGQFGYIPPVEVRELVLA